MFVAPLHSPRAQKKNDGQLHTRVMRKARRIDVVLEGCSFRDAFERNVVTRLGSHIE